MPGEWQHCPVHSRRLSFALRLQYSRYAAIQACSAAGRITASFQTTSLASLILPLPNSDLSVSEYTIVRNLILLTVDAEEKNAKGQHAEGHMEGLFPCKTGRCVIRLHREAALCFSHKSNKRTFTINWAELRFAHFRSACLSRSLSSVPVSPNCLQIPLNSGSTRHYSSLRTTAKSSSRSLILAEERWCSRSRTVAGGLFSRTCAHYHKGLERWPESLSPSSLHRQLHLDINIWGNLGTVLSACFLPLWTFPLPYQTQLLINWLHCHLVLPPAPRHHSARF